MTNQDLHNRSLQDIINARGANGGFDESRIRRSRDFEFYGITQSRTGSLESTLCLKVIKSNMEQFIISYHDIGSPVKYDGKEEIGLSTSNLHITIKGKGMERVLDYLAEHRLMWIKEPQNSHETFESSYNEQDIVISSIEIDSIH